MNELKIMALNNFRFGMDYVASNLFNDIGSEVFSFFDKVPQYGSALGWSFHCMDYPSQRLLFDKRLTKYDLQILRMRVSIDLINRSLVLANYPSTNQGFFAYAERSFSQDNVGKKLSASQRREIIEAESYFAAGMFEYRKNCIDTLTHYSSFIEQLIQMFHGEHNSEIGNTDSKTIKPLSANELIAEAEPKLPDNSYFKVLGVNKIVWKVSKNQLYDYLVRTSVFGSMPQYTNRELRRTSAELAFLSPQQPDSKLQLDRSHYGKVYNKDINVRDPLPDDLVELLDRFWKPM